MSPREKREWLIWLAITFLACSLALWLTSCGHLTTAPRPIAAGAIAMGTTNKPDADVIDGNASGLLVRQGWIDRYAALALKLKEPVFLPDRQIKAEGDNYRVPYPVSDHMADMRRVERLAEAGP